MINDLLKDRAALYATGAMSAQEREQFELVLEFNEELREFTGKLADAGTLVTLATQPSVKPARFSALKSRILGLVTDRPQLTAADGMVVCGPDRMVDWVNPAFSEMCGYTLEELRGKNLGPILQGEKTDRETIGRMRKAVHECRPCRETILNYHKNGSLYWVEVAITPVLDDAGQLLWLVAREREITDLAIA